MAKNDQIAVCLFEAPEGARDAINALKDAGFAGGAISLLMPDRLETARPGEHTGAGSIGGSVARVVAGGILGALGGWLVGLGAVTIPGIGPLVAAGALAGPLSAAAVGAGVGALASALMDVGIPEKDVGYYTQEVQRGRSLVVVQAGIRAAEADRLLHTYAGYDAQHGNQAPTAVGTR